MIILLILLTMGKEACADNTKEFEQIISDYKSNTTNDIVDIAKKTTSIDVYMRALQMSLDSKDNNLIVSIIISGLINPTLWDDSFEDGETESARFVARNKIVEQINKLGLKVSATDLLNISKRKKIIEQLRQ